MDMQSSSTALIRIVAILVLITTLPGCVMTPEGPLVSFSSTTEPLVNKKFSHYKGVPSDFKNPFPDLISVTPDSRKGIIVIGRLSAYRKFGEEFGERSIELGYINYVDSFRKGRTDATPTLSSAEFAKTVSGWTNIQTYGTAFFGAVYHRALVAADVANELTFENPVHSFIAYDSADLVVAETNADGALIVRKLLCKEGPDFSDCAAQYKKGRFDLETGLALTMGLKPNVTAAVLIDPVSYKILRGGS